MLSFRCFARFLISTHQVQRTGRRTVMSLPSCCWSSGILAVGHGVKLSVSVACTRHVSNYRACRSTSAIKSCVKIRNNPFQDNVVLNPLDVGLGIKQENVPLINKILPDVANVDNSILDVLLNLNGVFVKVELGQDMKSCVCILASAEPDCELAILGERVHQVDRIFFNPGKERHRMHRDLVVQKQPSGRRSQVAACQLSARDHEKGLIQIAPSSLVGFGATAWSLLWPCWCCWNQTRLLQLIRLVYERCQVLC